MSPVLISAIVSISIFGLATYINIKTKFAADEKEAMRHVKTLALNLILIISCAWTAYKLYEDFSSPTPLDKQSLLIILINSFGLFYVLIVRHLHYILSVNEKSIALFSDFSKTTKVSHKILSDEITLVKEQIKKMQEEPLGPMIG